MKRMTVLGAGLAAVAMCVPAAPVQADCVGAHVEVRVQGQPTTVLAENSCLVPTTWPLWARVGHEQDTYNVPPGTHYGFDAFVWFPVP